MAGPRQLRIDTEARRNWARYQDSIQHAYKWMYETRCSQRRLAEVLGETESHVSLFLSGTLEHAPCRQRPAMMRVMERIESMCCDPDQVWMHSPPIVTHPTDERLWGEQLTIQINGLIASLDPQATVRRFRDLGISALYGPEPQRCYVCSNLLLLIAETVKQLAAGRASDTCRISTKEIAGILGIVDRLEEVALVGFDSIPSEWRPQHEKARVLGYAGHARAWSGLLSRDERVAAEGLQGMIRGAMLPHRIKSTLWPNAFYFLEHLLTTKARLGSELIDHVAEATAGYSSAQLDLALRAELFPSVRGALNDRRLFLLPSTGSQGMQR